MMSPSWGTSAPSAGACQRRPQSGPSASTLALMPSRVWLPSDALAFRCDVADVGTLAPAVEVLDPLPPALPEPQELKQRALAALLRIAESVDTRAGVDAAVALLDHVSRETPSQTTPPAEPWLTGTRYRPDLSDTPADYRPCLPDAPPDYGESMPDQAPLSAGRH